MACGAVDGLAPACDPPVRRPYSTLAVCGFLLLAVVAVFGRTAGYDFVNVDDDEAVSENSHVQRGLTREGIVWALTTYYTTSWHPLTWLSHMLDCKLYGLKPGGHHLTNVLLHAMAAVLLFLALRRMTGALWPSAWVAAVFAIHPLRVESVAWVTERKDVLSGLLLMLTLWFYARYAERPASWGRYLLVVASAALALTAKPMLVTLPFMLLLLDYWPLGRLGPGREGSEEAGASPRRPWRRFVRLVVEKIPFFVLAAAVCALTLAAQRGVVKPLAQMPVLWRLANAAVAYVAYVGRMFYPVGLALLHPAPKTAPPAWETVAAVAVLLAITMAAFGARRKCPYVLVGWLWYLGTLVPVLGLVQVGREGMADRFTYVTQIGLSIAFAWGAAQVAGSSRDRRWGVAAVGALVVAGLMVCAWRQTRYWRDSEALWSRTLACIPAQEPIAHNNLGNVLAARGEVDAAIDHYRRALEIDPGYLEAHNNLGSALAGRGQFDAAIVEYRRALDIDPDYLMAHNNLGNALAALGQSEAAIDEFRKAVKLNSNYAMVYNNLGIVLARQGQLDEAIAEYRKALKLAPDDAHFHNNLGSALAGRGRVDEAILHYRKALEHKPGYAEAHYNLAGALAGQGQFDEAIVHYRSAVEISPGDADAQCNLGGALAGRGQFDEAIVHCRKAVEIKPDYLEAHYNLALALAGRGRVNEAIDHYRKALALASARHDRALADAIRAQIRLYQATAPARSAP